MDSIVTTNCGRIEGRKSADGSVLAFRGVPYAKPPVAELRWRPPLPPDAWGGVRPALDAGPIAIQVPIPATSLFPFGHERQSEDCLYLNIWTGAQRPDERRPVVVWLHLGAFQFGSGSNPMSDADVWARAGIVFVSVNYRLGRFGFFAHPDLCGESDAKTAGNYGLLDQIRALEWVRDNIAGFGGDPGCVTVYGVSAGSASISLLFSAPSAHGLFHRAIAESGGFFGPSGRLTGIGDVLQTLDVACENGRRWGDKLGLTSLKELRAASAEDLLAASMIDWSGFEDLFDGAQPIIDGVVVPDSCRAIFERGQQAPVPLLTGSAANEDLLLAFSPTLAAYRTAARAQFGERSDEFLALYPAANDAEAVAASLKSNSDRVFTWQNWTWARLHSRLKKAAVYYYRFAQVPPVPAGGGYFEQSFPRPLGAFHAASLFYVFDRFSLRPWQWQERDRRVGEWYRSSLVTFAASGKPHAVDMTAWPMFDALAPARFEMCDQPRLIRTGHSAQLSFWDSHYAGQ